MTALRTNFDFSRWRYHAMSPPVLPVSQNLFQNRVYYIPYKTLEEQGISFADFALSKLYYNELAFLFEDASSRNPYTKKEVDFILGVAKRYGDNPRSFLDIPCGVGRHDRELSNLGYEVVGIDVSEKLLKVARSKDKITTYKQSDMRHFELGRKFDCVLCIWDAFVYLSQERDVELFLEKCLKHLKKDRLLIVDFRNYFKEGLKPWVIHESFSSGQFEVELIGRKQNIDLDAKVSESIFMYNVRDTIGQNSGVFVDQELVRTYSLDDLERFFRNNFRILDVYGDFDLENKFDPKKSERLIVAARVV